MDIKQLLSGYQNRMLKKFEKQAESEIKDATERDVVRKGIEQIKKNTLEQYKMLHEGISEEDGTPFTDDELADLINKITLPMEWKLSQKTKNLIDKEESYEK